MKKLKLAIALLTSGAVVTQASNNHNYQMSVAADEQKVEITMEELPEQVVTAFQESEFSNWTVEKIYQVTDETTQSNYYQFNLKNGEETKNVKVDGQGQISELEKANDQENMQGQMPEPQDQ
jgi:hypothetical protein